MPRAAWAAEIVRVLAGLAHMLRGGRLTEPVVHRSRRELKRLRSLLRLASGASAELAAETREVTGVLRRHLGHTRDAAVMLKTLQSLAGDLGETAARIKPVLSLHHRAASATLDRASRRSDRERIVRLGAQWRARRAGGGLDKLHGQAVKTYREARRRFRALGAGKLSALHPLRKVCVDHQNHLAFFATYADSAIAKRHAKVRKLRDRLGLCHDLEVLRDFVRTRTDVSAVDLIRLEEVLTKRHLRLVAKSMKLAETLLDEKPRGFGKWLKREIPDRAGELATKRLPELGEEAAE